jgi:hypothetical protein
LQPRQEPTRTQAPLALGPGPPALSGETWSKTGPAPGPTPPWIKPRDLVFGALTEVAVDRVPRSAGGMGPTARRRQEGPMWAVEFCSHAPFRGWKAVPQPHVHGPRPCGCSGHVLGSVPGDGVVALWPPGLLSKCGDSFPRVLAVPGVTAGVAREWDTPPYRGPMALAWRGVYASYRSDLYIFAVYYRPNIK